MAMSGNRSGCNLISESARTIIDSEHITKRIQSLVCRAVISVFLRCKVTSFFSDHKKVVTFYSAKNG